MVSLGQKYGRYVDAHGVALVCLALQGGSGVVPCRISHHRPARVHPVQLRRDVHHGDGTVRQHTELISGCACVGVGGRGCGELPVWITACASAAGGSLRTFLEMKPRDASWLPGTPRAPSSSERARRPQVTPCNASRTRASVSTCNMEPRATAALSANVLVHVQRLHPLRFRVLLFIHQGL